MRVQRRRALWPLAAAVILGCSKGEVSTLPPDPFDQDVIELPVEDKPPSGLDAPPLGPEDGGELPMSSLCGNGMREGDESCDGDPPRPCAMVDPGLGGGAASCTPGCSWDLSACTFGGAAACGNGRVDPGEDCDGAGFNAACVGPEFSGGMLRCNNCRLDYSQCVRVPAACGNGMREGAEQCDDGNRDPNDACSNDCRAQGGSGPGPDGGAGDGGLDGGVAVEPPPPVEPPRPPGLPPVGALNPNNVCNDPATRLAARSNTVLKVSYRILVCQRSDGSFARSNADVRRAIEGARALFLRSPRLLPVEFDLQTFSHPTCEVLYEDAAVAQRVAEAVPPGVIPLAFFARINTLRNSFPVSGFAAYGRFAVIGDWGARVETRSRLIAHELGHFLGLAHTHECAVGRETAETCATSGDRMCDTPPDRGPRPLRGLALCDDMQSLDGTCEQGACGPGRCDDGARPDRTNVMGYYGCDQPVFSQVQGDFVRCGLTHELTAFNRGNACGDGVCDRYEDAFNCPGDCPVACMGQTDREESTEGPTCGNIDLAWGNAVVNVAYFPFRTARATPLLSGEPGCGSAPGAGRVVAMLPAGARFGAQSTRNPNCIDSPPLRSGVRGADNALYRFGYAPDATGETQYGWVRIVDLTYDGANASNTCMTGPEGQDFQAAQNPHRGCALTACSGRDRVCRTANPSSEDEDACRGGRVTDSAATVNGFWPVYYAPGVTVKRFVHRGDRVRVRYVSGAWSFVIITQSACPRFSPTNTVGWVSSTALD